MTLAPRTANRTCKAVRYVYRSALIGIACVILLVTGGSVQASSARRSQVVEVVERVRAAVVNIHSERTAQGPATAEMLSMTPSQHRINGMGTGVIIDPRGYVVTNQHVVDDVNILRVRLSDGATYSATVVARDHESDLALLKIEARRPLTCVPIGTARDLMVGETVIAIGNAYGYEHTVTVGIVSAVKRDVSLNKEVSYKGLIQTDASINPGNSGGPLLNIDGEMVGINVAIRAGAQGISFAIPVDTVIQAVATMIASKNANGCWHGMVCRNHLRHGEVDFKLSSNKKANKDSAGEGGDGQTPGGTLQRELVVERVESGSPAAVAGLQTGDIVSQVANTQVDSTLDLERALLDHTAGEHVPLVVRRKGTEQHLDLVLQAQEHGEAAPAELVWRKLGIRLKPIGSELVSRVSQQLHGGLAITEVGPRSVAEKAGIQRGDILVGLHQWETLTVDNVAFVLSHPDLNSFYPLSFYVIRSGQVRRGWLPQMD